MTNDQQFFLACERGDLDAAQSLITGITDINMKTPEGWTPLVKAVRSEHFELCQWLVEQGADIHATNHKGTTIFMYAKQPVYDSKDTTILQWLIDLGVDLNAVEHRNMTVLDYVQQAGHDWLADWLMDRGAINSSDSL